MFALADSKPTVVATLGRGLLAGIAGTAVMTGLQLLTQKLQNGGAGDKPPETWSDAPAPAQVAEKTAETVGTTLPLEQAPAIGNAVHWLYGTLWGTAYGLAKRGFDGVGFAPAGAGFGTAVWAASYAQLVPLGIYKPPWRYPAKELALDVSYHLAYGVTVAATYKTLSR